MEQIERLAAQQDWEVLLYSQRVEDVKGVSSNSAKDSGGTIFWRKVPDISGPHLIKFIWWFAANHLARWRDSRNPDLLPDVIYSPGINCMDTDAIDVHIVFHEFYKCVRPEMRLSRLPLAAWPRTLHRKLYYRLIMFLEQRIYRNPRVRLAAVSQHLANKLQIHFQRTDVVVITNAVDSEKFFPAVRLARRSEEVSRLDLPRRILSSYSSGMIGRTRVWTKFSRRRSYSGRSHSICWLLAAMIHACTAIS